MILSIVIYGVVGSLYARGMWQAFKLLFGPLVRHYPPRPERCPGCPEGWS